jgi:hypothetical protein
MFWFQQKVFLSLKQKIILVGFLATQSGQNGLKQLVGENMHIPVKTATYSGNNLTALQSSSSLVDSNTKVAGLRQCFA